MTDAIPNASLPPSLILEVTSVFNLGKPHSHHQLVHGRSQPNFYLKTQAGPFVLSLREVTPDIPRAEAASVAIAGQQGLPVAVRRATRHGALAHELPDGRCITVTDFLRRQTSCAHA